MRNAISTLLVLTGFLLTDSGRAATVTTTADDGPGSLREAIANAALGETINFSTSGTITLTSGELSIDKDLIISGPGADNLLIQRSTDSGTPNFRIFNVLSGIVKLSGLTVSNGRDDVGGGINNQSDLTLNGCVIAGNSATESGGGIFNMSTIVASNCVVRGNSAAGETWDGFGGGIYSSGTLTVINGTIRSNSITSGASGGFGGGICNDGTLTVLRSVIKDNSATGWQDGGGGFGGGFYTGFGTSYLDESTVSGNVARGGGAGLGEGGGVGNYVGTVELQRSTVSGNSAVGGDGSGPGEGGGIANDFGTVYVESSTVSGNISSGAAGTVGGGLFNDSGSLDLSYSTITANVVPGGSPDDGAGIFNLEGSVELESSIIAANNAAVDFFNGDFGFIVNHGYNLIGSMSGYFPLEAGDQFISAAALKLGPLQDNGGPTFTHALLCGSVAIEAGNNTGAPATDQRGFARIVHGVIDIGAYETGNHVPTINCPSPITLNCAPPEGMVATLSVTVADADGDPLVVVWTVDGTAYQTNLVAAGGPPTDTAVGLTNLFGLGSHELTVSVSDPSGCLATCSTTVEVEAFVPPTVSCPTVQDASANQDCLAAVPNVLTNVTVNAQCASGEMTLIQSPAAGTLLGLGTHTITVTATDDDGNSAECTTTFTVTDNTPPTVSCPPASSASADANCQAAVPSVSASVSDNCSAPGAITLTQSPAAGTQVGLGAHTITVTATDAAGNSASCTTTFTVTDNTPPTVSCPPTSSASADANCQAAVPSVSASVSDNCSAPGAITLIQSPAAGTQVGLGAHTITVTATDAAGNSASCTSTFTVTDNTPPTVSCPPASSASADANCQAPVPTVAASVSDNCSAAGAITITQSPAAGTLVGLGTHAITVTATDAAGNSASCTTSFTVSDTTAPTVVCPAVPSASADANCQAAVPTVAASVSDNCSAAGAITITQSPAAGTLVGLGMHSITVTATDAAGNSASCTTSFAVTDTTAPTVACPTVPDASADANCQAAVPTVAASASDNCSAAGAITITQSPAAGTLVALGLHTITVTATDAAGNSASCSTSFTVTDNTPPSVVCPAVPDASADANCQAAVPTVAASVSDNCTAAGAITITQSPAAGTLVGLGTNTITVTATDAAGNSATCTTTFKVTGNATMTLACPAATSASADTNCQAAVPNVLDGVTLSGGCNGTNGVTMSQSPAAGTLMGLGMHMITVTATDAAGNTATCTTTFTVTDDTAPSVICPTLPSASANANCQAAVPTVAATVSDNCTAANAITLTQSPIAGTMVGLGAHTITVTATDAAGNSASCTTTFTVTDNTPPTVSCPAATSASANCQAPVPNVLSGVTASDNCSSAGSITLTQSPTAGTMVGLGAHTITVTATDAAGNSTSCTTSFTVTDSTPPTVSCPAATSASAGDNCQAPVPNVLSGVTVSDNCSAVGSITLSQSPAAGTLVGLGTNTITVTATDAAGNSASCTTLFTVTGNASLTVTCPAVPGANTDANCQAAVPNILSGVTVSSGCGTPGTVSLSQSPVPGTLVGVGTHTITVTATNAAGSSATCTTTFTVTGQGAAIQIVLTTPAYPFASANPLTSIAFNESEVLRSSVVYTAPDTTNCMAGSIGMFYNDEHAMALGVRRVVVKTATGTTTNDYPISPLPTVPASVTSPLVGSTIATGDQAGVDVSGRPLYPALFITDITTDPNSLSGDWQYGGTAFPPTAIFGTWKGFVKTVDKTRSPATVTLTSDADPAENNWVLGPGSDPVPAGLDNEGYGTEVRWDVSQLGLVTGHRYRFYFIVHDGDQNKAGGDTGQACATLAVPDAATKLAIQAQPSPSATAGVPFAQQPVIRIEDAYGNLRYSDNSTVVTVTRSAGSGTLQGTLTATAVNGVVTFTNLSHNLASTISLSFTASGLTGATSDNIVVNPGAFAKLQLLAPGETAAPASASGKTGTPIAQTAGTAFNVTVNAVDANWNLVPSANGSSYTIGITSSDANATLPSNADLSSGTRTFSVTLKTAGSATITASDVDDATKTANTSPSITVNASAFARLQILVPGETAAPGTSAGKTGTPTSSTAGTAFNITVNAVDNFWNVINTVTDMVHISSTDSNATLPADTALVSGTRTLSVTFKSLGSQTLTATDATDGSKTANTSPSMTVNAGAFVKLQLLVPGETAAPFTATGKTGTPTAQSAGTAFNVTVNAVDANWNLVTSANGTAYTVGITSSDANATLPANADLSSGTRTFSVTLKTAGSATVTASDLDDATKTAATSPITVNLGAFTKLQILLPGETAAPGSTTGKTGTPTAQTAGTPFNVTVNAVDANWNPITTVTDTVGISTSDLNDTHPANAALVAGTQTFSVTLKTAGSGTVTASDVSDLTKTANTSASVTVNAGPFVKLQVLVPGETAAPGTASGKTGIPSTQTAGTNFNVTIRSVDALWNVASSTDTVGITSSDSNAILPANGALSAGTRTASINLRTAGSYTVTATDITDGTKTANTSPPITNNAGAASKLMIQTQPSPGATAGVAFAQQPIIRIEDAYGNLRSGDNSTVVTVARSAGSGTLQGTLTATAVNGVVTFANLSHNVANTITLSFTASGLTSATSDNIVVSPTAFTKLQLLVPGETAAPGSASGKTGTPTSSTAGTAFNITVNAVDNFWNVVNTVTDMVDISSTDANATLPADTALVSGTRTLSVTFKSTGSQTLTATDATDGSKTANTSLSMTVNAGAFVKLQLLVPGETAAPGTATGKTGTPTAQSAGTAVNVTVNAVDANWNLVTSANGAAYTVGITSSDANATLPSNANLSSGTRAFSVTLKTAGSATITASDVDDATKTAYTSPSITVNAGAFTKLQILVPGETAVPGSATGKTGTPTAQTAGTPFNVTVNAVDANWNFLNTVTDTVGISTSDVNDTHPANTALVSGTQTFSVTLKTAGSGTVTASDVSDLTKTANTSASVTVNAGPFVKLQVLVPGETAVPGTASGKTGIPSAQTAGTDFNVTIRSVDALWNVASSTDTVGITSTDSNAALPANVALSSGTKTVKVTLKTVGSYTVTGTDITDGTKPANTSPAITVNVGAADRLIVQTQPSPTATAGISFVQQPVVRIEDAYGNLRSSDNTVITVGRSAGSGTLQGTLTATAVNGVATFANLSHNVANTITLSFTASGLTSATSGNVVVSPAAFAKLLLLVPGETAAPGSASGKTGTPTASTAGTAFNITVNAVDNFWNVVNTVTDTVGIASSDANADLPASAAMVSGTQTLSVTFKTGGSQTLTASDLTNASKTPSTSPAMTVNAGAFVKLQLVVPGETAAPGTATGKTGTPTAQSAGTAISVTVNAVDANWNLVTSANGSAYTIGITSSDANATLPANADLSSGTRTFSVTLKTAGSATVTASDVDDATKTAATSPITVNLGAFTKLQILLPGETAAPGSTTGKTGTPTAQTAGTPFNVTVNAVDANWNFVNSVTDTVGITSSDANTVLPANAALVAGTQSFSVTLKTAGSLTLTASDISDGTKTANTSPSITVNAGLFAKLQVLVPGETAAPGTASGKTGTPSATTAGTAFNVTVNAVDAQWNLVSSTHTVGITSSDTNAVLSANGALSAGARTVSATLKTAGSHTVTATDITDGTKTANTSPTITVNVGAASKLTVQTQPSTATAGAAFLQQPVIRVEDAYGNLRSSDNSTVVTVARSAGSGTLQGTLTATAVNGVVTFANLSHNVANTITLSFTASGLTSATSDIIVVSPAAFAKLQLLVPGETAAPGSASGKTGSPTSTTAGTAFNITVNAVDALWNVVNIVTDVVDVASSDTNATLPADTALVSGTRTLSVTLKTAGSQTLTATDVTDGSKSANTSPSITVNVGAFVKLQLLVPGETAAPGSVTGKSGTPSNQTVGIGYSVTVRAVDANWNFVNTSTDTVGITCTDSNDLLPANAALVAGIKSFGLTNRTAGSWTITASDITDATKTANTSPSITLNAGAFVKMQILLPGETAASGSATGKTGTPSAQTSGTPFNVTVNAVDANWNTVATVTDTVGITSSDANAVLPANAALVAGTKTISVTLKTAGNSTVTATDVTDGTKTANTSPSITVNVGAFAKLQVLVPGETAAPGTASGKTGTPSAATAGTAFNVTINAVDANWNLVSSTHTVGTTSSDSNAVLPANGALAAGTRTVSVTLKTTGSQTVTATDITDGTKTANTSTAITVNAGAASKLTIQTQPSTSATAGAAFGTQPVIRVEDVYGNLRSSDNSTVVTVARSAGSGTLQGTLTATAVNGVVTFTDLSHNVANTIALNFTASGLTNATSGNIVVSPAAFVKLQLLVPGETAAPGTASGKTGTPTASTAATAFNVTVNAVDSFWNVISSITDTVGITSTDTNATLPANIALVSGTKTLSVTLKTAGSQTLTASDVTNSSKTANTSPSLTVNAGSFTKLQLLVPGETAAPGTASGKTGTPSNQTVVVGYSVTVRAVDANWNLVNTSTDTVGISCTDPNDLLPANAALVAGTKSLSLTNSTAGSWTITASDITDAAKTASTSPSISVNTGAFAKLQILLPGETAAPGSATGKTGTPTAQTAGTPFNVTVNAVDANWNTITTATDTVGITASDANAAPPTNAALVAGTRTFSVTLKTAGSRTLTSTDVTDGTKSANTSPSVTVNAGAFVKLQLLMPGETAAPGTASGKTGTPSALAAGTPYNVTINSVDACWNLVSSTHTAGITSSDSSATLPANGALSAGTRTASVTLRTIGFQTVTATDITDGTKTANTSPPITVNVGTATKLTIQTQPSSSATAGAVFAQQPVIRVEDASGNLATTDNGRVITVARSAGTGTLQGTLTATTVNGVATFANLSHNVANTITLSFTASGLTSATSGNIVVSPGTATQLLITTQPSGTRTGSPLGTQPVVKAQDAYGNTSSAGLPASLNVSLVLTGGSGSLLGTTSLDIGSAAGNGTATFTTVECSDAGTNKQITASAAGFADAISSLFDLDGVERATGGTAIPSSTAGGTYTTLTGPVYYEYASGDVGTGTIILNPPAGFVFDTGGTAPTVRIDRLSGSGLNDKNINKKASGTSVAITSRSAAQITFTVTDASGSGVSCSLTWQNVRVRPAAASPLASGNITKTGTSVMAVVTNSITSFGRLIEIGPAARLAIQTQPSSTATAGVPFAQQPVVRIEDAVGNLLTSDNTTVVTATRSAGSGTLQGTTNRTAVNGLVTFTDLAHNVAGNITISFTSGTLTNATSTAIAVSPAAASQLAFTTQPANGTFGSLLATQPVLRSRDQFDNDSSIGLGANLSVTMTLSAGTGPLLGTTTLDIGTSAGNGVISFSDLRIDSAGTDKQFTASASGLTSATSSVFTVAKASQTISFGALAARTYGDAPFTIGASASSALPVGFSIVSGPATISGNSVTITGAGTVTVRASQSGDANWNAATSVDQSFAVAKLTVTGSITSNNKVYDGTTAATIATRTLSGVLGSDSVNLSGGTATFADKNVGTGKTVTATGLSLSGANAGNYQLASTSAATTADITATTLTGGITANNKTYDGSTAATIATRTLSGVLGSEAVSLVGGTATFADKNAGTGKTVTATGLSLSGADAGNYQLASTSATTTAGIAARTLTVSATGENKVYDGTTTAAVTLSDNRVSGDYLTTSYTAAEFANKNVGTGKTVSVSGISVSGTDAANYTVSTTASTAADITPRALTVSAVGANKVYDGTTEAWATLLDDRIAGDDLTASYTTASFADSNVQNGKLVSVSGISLSGADAGNYTANTEASTVADITGATLTVVGITAQNKVYDGTTVATLNLDGAVAIGLVSGDDVTVDASGVAGAFSDAEVGTGKLVTVSGLTLIGADAGKYTLTQPTTTADITPAP